MDFCLLVGTQESEATQHWVLVIADAASGAIHAVYCPSKTATEYMVQVVAKFINGLGYDRVILHTDQEPSIMKQAKEVQKARARPVITRTGARYSHQSQGLVERAVRTVKGQPRAIWTADRKSVV